jgi:tRNA G18 (ribose-2'-O)-methylase SpoU
VPAVTSADLERRILRVERLDDPRLADYRELREADLAGRREAFIAESEVVLRVLALRGRFALRSLLLAAPRLARLADVVAGLPPEVPVYIAEQELLDQIVGFRIHRGVLAAGRRQPLPSPAKLIESLPSGVCRVVVLEALTNHDNVGGVFRNAAAFGARAVLFDRPTCDPLYRKAIRVSAGASLLVPFARAETSAEILEALRDAGFWTLALTPGAQARDLYTLERLPERVALLVGTEGVGLSERALAAADERLRIAMEPGFDSLNVATASGIALSAVRALQLGQNV